MSVLGRRRLGIRAVYSPEGIFCGQDFLVAPTEIRSETFVPDHGPCAGERVLTFFHENQGCFFLHVPLDRGDDPIVFKTDYPQVGRWAKPETLQGMDGRLGSVLASFSLQEAVLGCNKQWFRNRSFEASDYKPQIALLKSTMHYGNPDIPIEFYVDEDERLMMMNFSEIDMIHIAARGMVAEEIFRDFDELEDCI